jgi:hypothetical protein
VSSLREKWRRRTDAAFERMFSDKNQEELVTFTEREDLVALIAKEMAAFLLEEHLARDPLVRPAEAAAAGCPKCGKAGERCNEEGRSLARPMRHHPRGRGRTQAGTLAVPELPNPFFFRSTFG